VPDFGGGPVKYRPAKPVEEEWKSFRKGLNLLLRETELDNEELSVADNIMLVGKGVPTGRYGTVTYFTANATGSIRGFGTYKSNDGETNELLALSDEGYLVKQDGTGSTVITGQSWPSGSQIRTEQLGGETYIVSEDKEFTSYAGGNLTVFSQIGAPTGLSVTNFSGVSGPNNLSYQVVAVGANGGQTTPSGSYVLQNVPSNLALSQYHLFWTGPSHATLSGYEIYRGRQGDETFLASVGPDNTSYVDSGDAASVTILAPLTNTTGGVKSKFIKKYKDRLLVVPEDDPNKLMVSGRYPNHTKFSWLDGGGYIYIDPDSGDNITGVEVQPIADRIVVYKDRSSYLVETQLVTIGNFAVLDPQYQPISTAVGCSSQKTIATVENDTFYFGRDGLYVTGYEPNFLNIIRTNEISAKIRPYLDDLNDTDYTGACAIYVDKKYILSFPQKKEMVVYDRERGAWLGPWKFPYGVSHMTKYVDGTGTERWVLGANASNQVYRFDTATDSDDGTTTNKTLRTKKTPFGDWTVLNIIQFFYVLFRGIKGTTTVNLIIEDRDGSSSVAKTFTITGSATAGFSGFGADKFGTAKFGTSNSTSVAVLSDELTRWGPLFKQARLVQVEVTANSANSNFELLEIKLKAAKMGSGSLSSSQRV